MNRILFCGLGLFVLAQACASAQAPTGPRTKGVVYKTEVDRLVDVLRRTAIAANQPSLGGDSTLATAQILCAMANCHRRYHSSDGPIVRGMIDLLVKARAADGSYGDARTTAWAAEALLAIDADAHGDEAAQAQAWLQGKDAPAAPFAAAVSAVLDQVRADRFPQHLGAEAAKQATAWIEQPATLDRAAAAGTLVQLVACQVANKKLDGAQDSAPAVFSPAQQKAFAWLYAQQKNGRFAVQGREDPALTAFGMLALQTKPKELRTKEEQQTIEAGLKWLLEQQNEDGSFGQYLPNYTTCVAVGALARWDDPAVKAALEKAQRALLAFQNAESTGYQRSDRDYGGMGYGSGSSQRADLSNLQFSLDALRQTGLPENHEAFAKAIVFLQRTQNLKSVNDFSGKVADPDDKDGGLIDIASGDDGGAAYYPGNSAAGYVTTPDGKSIPRSYGSMTYALLKSYTLAGVKGDDPRVQAAVKWIQDNWTLAVNPGSDPALGEKVKYQGLFYYYMVLAQALDAAGIREVKVAGKDGKVEAIDWRKALRSHLEGMQQPDGTWVNGKNDRWMEGLPLLCTCYAMSALERCK